MRDLAFRVLGAVTRGAVRVAAGREKSTDVRAKVALFCAAIEHYPSYMESVLNRKRRLFFMLDKSQQSRALNTYKSLKQLEVCVKNNFTALRQLKAYAMQKFEIPQRDLWGQSPSTYGVVEIIEHMVRDWSDSSHHGRARELLFKPFWPYLENKKRVLVPGSGLGRLAFEISKRLDDEAIIDAPELSPSMYVGSLYATSQPTQCSLDFYPYLLEFSHLKSRKDQLQPAVVKFPQGKGMVNKPNFYYADFLKFDQGYRYDAITTLFFIDTAQNVFLYIDRIAEMLSPGGIWLNYGPLKWGTAAFIEFSADELLSYLRNSGWIIEKTWSGTNRYNGSDKSMLRTEYELVGWAARRV